MCLMNIIIFHASLEEKNLEKEVHCTKHFLKAFCVNFHNPLVLSNKAEEKDDGPVGYVQEDQLGSGPWLWGSPFTSTSPLAKLGNCPSALCLFCPFRAHFPSRLWAPLLRELLSSYNSPPSP